MNQTILTILCAILGGIIASRKFPFPDANPLIQLVLYRQPYVFWGLRWTWIVMMFTTPGLSASLVFSLIFIFTANREKARRAGKLPLFPTLQPGDPLSIVLGELHHPRKPIASEQPRWLVIPDRGLFTGILVVGAVGSGKTTAALFPYAKQILTYEAQDPQKRIGGIVLEVKGDFCASIREILNDAGRPDDYVEITLDGKYLYNPLHNDQEAFALAYAIATLLNNLYGKGKEPFWQQAYTNLVKFIILVFKCVEEYVTLFDVYRAAIDNTVIHNLIRAGEAKFAAMLEDSHTLKVWAIITPETYIEHEALAAWKWEPSGTNLRTRMDDDLLQQLAAIPYTLEEEKNHPTIDLDRLALRMQQLEAVKRWFQGDWQRIDNKLRTSIVEGISVFLSMFDDSPQLKRVFCPPKECYDPELNHDGRYGTPLPAFGELIELGRVVALNFPMSANPGTARAVGTFMKHDYQRAMLNRIPQMAKNPAQYFRPSMFLCDEYQAFATTGGEGEPSGDESFFALSRQAKCIAITAVQSISSLRSALGQNAWQTLIQNCRTKIFLTLSDHFSAEEASKLCGKENQMSPDYSISESGQDVRVNHVTGRAMAHKAGMTVNKRFAMMIRPLFEAKIFMELPNAQAIVLAYDGVNPLPPGYLYLKPHYANVQTTWFEQREKGVI